MKPMSLRTKLLTGTAVLCSLLALACGGAGQTSYPGPPPLTLTLQDPAEGVVVDRPTLVVKGVVSQPDALVACNGQALRVEASGAFQASLQLQLGANQVVVEAWTAADAKSGRGSGLLPPQDRVAARVVRNLTYQQPPLSLLVTAPTNGATFTTPTIALQGTVSDPSASVTMNGNTLTVDGAGAFTGTTTLQVGSNALVFLATASGGRSATETRSVTYTPPTPVVGPTVTILSPAEGLLTNAPTVTVTGTVSDPTASLTVFGLTTAVKSDGTWTQVIAPPEGQIAISATATNAAGQGQDTRHIVVDRTPPVITLTKPVPALTLLAVLPIEGNVDDPTALLTLENQSLSLDASGIFTASYGLAEGSNTLHFRAVDPAGNVGTLVVSTTRQTPPPQIFIDAPMDGFATNAGSVLVQGHVVDPTNTVVLQGESVPVDSTGHFERTINAPRLGVLPIGATATNAAGAQASAKVYVAFETDPPVLAWADPTPAEGSTLSTLQIPAAVTISKAALVSINGQRTELEPNESPTGQAAGAPAHPFRAQAEIAVQEGQVVLTAQAVDRAGNTAAITRNLAVGFTAPRITVESPAFDATGTFTTANVGVTLTGRVEAIDIVKPLTLTVNGQPTPLDAQGRFSLPLALVVGANPQALVATTRFGQKDTKTVTVVRTAGVPDPGAAPGIAIDWPQNGFVSGVPQITVKGRVTVPGMTATLAGAPVAVDPQTLAFTGVVDLQLGPNTITAIGTDAQARTATATVQGTYLQAGTATYTWLTPVDGTHVSSRTVPITGKADQPGIVTITVNGTPMSLEPALGTFSGSVELPGVGRQALLLQATALSGEVKTERREVVFEAPLPRIQLQAPGSARPGDTIAIQVTPAPGTNLVKADVTWNGRYLATVTAPWSAVQALVPADAVVGSAIAVEALGTDDQGATVTARTAVSVYGQGALMVEGYDDALGLPLTDEKTTVTVDGVPAAQAQTLDAHGRAALPTALPQNWIRVSKAGYTSLWRSASLQVGGVQAVADARLTKLADTRDVDGASFQGDFAQGLLHVTLPAGALSAATKLSATPLSTQGLPGLLPAGWSPVSAWWLDLGGATLQTPGSVSVDLSLMPATPTLPADAQYAWVRWDSEAHVWMVVAAPLSASALTNLSLPAPGGYALVLADPAPTAPPTAIAGSPLAAFLGKDWRDGLVATGSASSTLMATVAAINGAKVTASFNLAFNGGDPVPSGTLIQTDVLESYTLIDQSVIEPDGFTQDAVACRWMLEVVEGKPVLTGVTDGLGLRLPVRMSRTFDPTQLVEGRILVGFYHDGIQMASSGSELVGASGGTVIRDGVTLTFGVGAVTGPTLVRVQAEAGDPAALWSELASRGSVLKAFQVEIVGTMNAGLNLAVDALTVPAGVRPILVQRRVVQGQRLLLAAGELTPQGSKWGLTVPPGGNPLMDGGSFAVLAPPQAWDWISGTALIPAELANPVMQKLGAKARMMVLKAPQTKITKRAPAKGTTRKAASKPALQGSGDVAVADVSVEGGFLTAASGLTGAFAVPAFTPADATPITVTGSRWDLGVTGSFTASVPSAGNTLRLATTPFRVETVVPASGSTVPATVAFTLLLSAPADPATTGKVVLYREIAGTLTAVDARVALAQDGKTLLVTPAQALESATTYHLVVDGLAGLAGGAAPKSQYDYLTSTVVVPPPVDFTRFKLSYPDDNLNVTITVPEGAVPPRASLAVEAPGMGSVYTGFMPTAGDQTFTLKASLGERLHARTQLADGRVFEGYLSRYESTDGSGRVTIGVDGGKVAAVDGSGAVVTLPSGTLDHPVELKCQFTTDPSEDLLPELQTNLSIFGRVQLLAKEALQFKKLPRIEMKAPEGTEDLGEFKGFGGYSVFYRNSDFDPNGEPATFFEFMDTAKVDGGQLKGMGGLPWNLLEDEMPSIPDEDSQPTPLLRSKRSIMEKAKMPSNGGQMASDPTEVKCYVGVDDFPTERFFGGGGFLNLRSDDSFEVELDGMIVKDPGKVILKGKAYTYMPDGSRYRTVRAPLFYVAGDGDVSLQGRLMTRTNECGSYMLMNASYFGDPIQDNGTLMCLEPDFGIQQTKAKAVWNLWQTDTKHDRKLYQIPTFTFRVQPTQMGDQAAPWAAMEFGGGNYLGGGMAKAGALDAVVQAKDARDGVGLTVEVRVDDVVATLCGESSKGGVSNSAYSFAMGPGGSGVWTIHLNLYEGAHVVEALITDKSGNTARLRRTLQVMDYGVVSIRPVDPLKAPKFDVVVSGGLDAAKPDTLVKVQFSEPVKNVSSDTLHLEKLVGAAWQSLSDVRIRLGDVETGKTVVAWLLPTNLLELDGHYRVVADATITDCDPDTVGGPKALIQDPVEFHIQAHVPLGTVTIPSPRKVVAMGRTVFAVDGSDKLHMLLAMDYGLSEQKVFGDFQGQSVDAMVAFENASAPGLQYPGLLLVTTTPGGAAYGQNGVLWGFEFCTSSGVVNPLFSISLGPSMSGYSPGVDYRDGVIAVGRLTGSVALIRLADAIAKAPAKPALAVSPGGYGQSAIFQPFYLSDPDYQWNDGFSTRMSSGSNYGVAIAPVTLDMGGQQFLRTVVAYGGDLTAQLKNVPIAGFPSFWLPYTAGAEYKPMEPFVADAASLAISKTRFAAAASAYATTGVISNGAAAHEIQVWPNASVWIRGEKWKTTLGIGIGTAAKAPAGGNGLVVMDVNETDTSGKEKVWIWPKVSPFGAGIPYEIQYRKASLDPATGLCAVEVKNGSTGKMAWFILDMTRPEDPPVVDSFLASEGAGWSGSLSYGIFSATSGTGVSSWRVMAMASSGAPQVQQAALPKTETAPESKALAKAVSASGETRKAEAGKAQDTKPAVPSKGVHAQTFAKVEYRKEVAARVQAAFAWPPILPLMLCQVSVPRNDLAIDFLTINQGVERYLPTTDSNKQNDEAAMGLSFKNSVPVVANRAARVRVYVKNLATGANQISAEVTLYLRSASGEATIGTASVNTKYPTNDLYGDGNFAEFNLTEAQMSSGILMFRAVVDPSNRLNDTDRTNNSRVSVIPVEAAKRKVVYLHPLRVRWVNRRDGAGNLVYDAESGLTQDEVRSIKSQLKGKLQAFYPVGTRPGDLTVMTTDEIRDNNNQPLDLRWGVWKPSNEANFKMDSNGKSNRSQLLGWWQRVVEAQKAKAPQLAGSNDEMVYFVLVLKPELNKNVFPTVQNNTVAFKFVGGLSYVSQTNQTVWCVKTDGTQRVQNGSRPINSTIHTTDKMLEYIFSHELGHSHGIGHIDSDINVPDIAVTDPGSLESGWPGTRSGSSWNTSGAHRYDDGVVGVNTWDPIRKVSYLFDAGPRPSDPNQDKKKYDLMSYSVRGTQACQWMSDYSYVKCWEADRTYVMQAAGYSGYAVDLDRNNKTEVFDGKSISLGAKTTFAPDDPPDDRLRWSPQPGLTPTGSKDAAGEFWTAIFTAPSSPGMVLIPVTSQGDPRSSSTIQVLVEKVDVQVSPAASTATVGGTVQFTATVTGTVKGSTAVTWTATGGTINSMGLYTAPVTAGTYSVRATSVADPRKFKDVTVAVQ
jgi:hypothetical protein